MWTKQIDVAASVVALLRKRVRADGDYRNPCDLEREQDPRCREDTEWVAGELQRLEETRHFPERDGRWVLDEHGNMIYQPSQAEIGNICELIKGLRETRRGR